MELISTMHGTYRASGTLRWARTALTALAVLAAGAGAYRIHRASEIGVVDLLTSIAAILLLSGAMAAGWRLHVCKLRTRAETAEWMAKRAHRTESLLDGEEDRALWDSIPAAPDSDEDTCGIGLNVVVLNRFRYPKAG